jgi:hypothetical protein
MCFVNQDAAACNRPSRQQTETNKQTEQNKQINKTIYRLTCQHPS